jgi:hypothetical protein
MWKMGAMALVAEGRNAAMYSGNSYEWKIR